MVHTRLLGYRGGAWVLGYMGGLCKILSLILLILELAGLAGERRALTEGCVEVAGMVFE